MIHNQYHRQIFESSFLINLFRDTNIAHIFYKSSQSYRTQIVTTNIQGQREYASKLLTSIIVIDNLSKPCFSMETDTKSIGKYFCEGSDCSLPNLSTHYQPSDQRPRAKNKPCHRHPSGDVGQFSPPAPILNPLLK